MHCRARFAIAIIIALTTLSGCAADKPAKSITPAERARAAGMIPVMENKIALKIVQSTVDDIAKVDPEAGTRLGIDTHNDVWDSARGEDIARRDEVFEYYSRLMRRGVDFTKLTPDDRIKALLLEYAAKQTKLALDFRDYHNLINPVSGPQVRLPLFLITSQPAKTIKDFKDYIARLRAFEPYVADTIATTKARRKRGILLSTAGMKTVAAECQALTTGRPFSAGGNASPLLNDFVSKVRHAKFDAGTRQTLEQQAEDALVHSVGPGCRKLSAYAMSLAGAKDPELTSLPKGAAFYEERLAWFTSTNLTATAVHHLAIQQLAEVTRQIDAVMGKRGFKGSSAQFMAQLRSDKKYRIPGGSANIQKWLNKTGSYVLALDASLSDMLAPLPDTDLDVREMETFQQPAGDIATYYPGRQLSVYFINLTAVPSDELEAVTFRYSIPGRHAIPLSPLNRIAPVPAFTDGWSLYSLRLPLKYSYYKEPGAKLGRLLVTSTAIAEAVVDIGMHTEHWDRAQAVRYLLAHSTMSRQQANKAVDRILAEPGAATAAVVGEATIERLHKKCQQALGKSFSDKAFNKAVVEHGPIPMPLLEDTVNKWLERQLGGKSPSTQP